MLEPSSSHGLALRITASQVPNKFGRETVSSLCKELLQMHNRGVWRPVDLRCLLHRNQKIIRSLVFFKEKTFSAGELEMPKACLTSGYKQDKSINSGNDTGAPAVVLQSVYTTSTITAYEGLAAVKAFITEPY